MAFIREKKLSNTNLLVSRQIKRKKTSPPVDTHCSKTSLLKLTISDGQRGRVRENKVGSLHH